MVPRSLPVLAEVLFARFCQVLADIGPILHAQIWTVHVCSGILAEVHANVQTIWRVMRKGSTACLSSF
jgi:hypothetical protein